MDLCVCVCEWVSVGALCDPAQRYVQHSPAIGRRTTFDRPSDGDIFSLIRRRRRRSFSSSDWQNPPSSFHLDCPLTFRLIVVVFFSLYTQLLCECCSIGKGLCCCCCKCFRHDLFVSIPCASSSLPSPLSFSLSIWPANRERQIRFKSNSAHSCATSFSLCIRSQTLFFFFYVRLVALFLYNNKTKWLFVYFCVCVCVSSM